jgi:transcriptional regulator with XRE-family HTH domain
MIRQARGLTQWAMGERGLSYKYYQRIESGRANVTIRTLARVARALGVPLAEIFRSEHHQRARRDRGSRAS